MTVSSDWFDVIQSGSRTPDVAPVWKVGTGNLASLAENLIYPAWFSAVREKEAKPGVVI